MPPPLLHLPDEAAYRRHFVNTYCRGVIRTHDGYRVYFQEYQFNHSFYESSRRDGNKDVFSQVRAERMDWIRATLADSTATGYKGWIGKESRYDSTRRVEILREDFVVVIKFKKAVNGNLKCEFITCFQADNSIGKIRTSPLWNIADCLNELR